MSNDKKKKKKKKKRGNMLQWSFNRNLPSSVGIETRLRVGRSGLIFPRGNDGIFSLLHGFQTGSGAHTVLNPVGSGDSLRRG
jgi:hypothetical protein